MGSLNLMAFVLPYECSVVMPTLRTQPRKQRPVDFINFAYSAKLGGLIDELKISPTILANNDSADERYSSTQPSTACALQQVTHGRTNKFLRGKIALPKILSVRRPCKAHVHTGIATERRNDGAFQIADLK